MNRFTLLPSVNWDSSHMLVLNEAGTICAYGSRSDIIIIRNIHQNNLTEINPGIIYKAHRNQRCTALNFVKHTTDNNTIDIIVSCGDDGQIKVWNLDTLTNTHIFTSKNHQPNLKFVDIDHFKQTSIVVTVADRDIIVKWDLSVNKATIFYVPPKILMTCISTCPHDNDLIAIGARTGLVIVYSLKGEGKICHKIRCHESDVFSLSWCPVPYNAIALFQLRDDPSFSESEFIDADKTMLLASCSKDKSIYVFRAGTNGYCEAILTLPAKYTFSSSNRKANIPPSNIERGRFINWISADSIVTFIDDNELVLAKIIPKLNAKTNAKFISNVRLDLKPLHSVHKRNINNFAVHILNPKDLSFRVWSCAADRTIVRSSYGPNFKEKPVTFHLLSGFIFSLDISPTTLDRLAIGTGDGKICLWELSSENSIDVTTLSKKIDSKVMCLKWHPYEEGILAFGTFEGRVGIFDVSMGSRTTPFLFKIYHHKPIYKLCWAPPIVTNSETKVSGNFQSSLYVFAVGNGEILQYNPNDVTEMPICLNSDFFPSMEEKSSCKFKTDFIFEENRDVIVIGLGNGDVCIFDKTHSLQHVIKEQPKSIMALAWHPRYIFEAPREISMYSNWLATAADKVFVYQIDPSGNDIPVKIASLDLHTNRVLDIAWNPHISGRLLSCSSDSSVIVWDVITQTIIGRYEEHLAPVLSGLWSMTNKDVAITGSSDFTCRMWSVSKDTVATVKAAKKNAAKPVEPLVINSHTVKTMGTTPIENGKTSSLTISSSRLTKMDTFLPSISHEIHNCSMLETVVKNLLNKTSSNSLKTVDPDSSNVNNCEASPIVEDAMSCSNSVDDGMNGSLDQAIYINGSISQDENLLCEESKLLRSRKNKKKKSMGLENYHHLFGSFDELLNFIKQEEMVLEKSESKNAFVLYQAHYDLKAKIEHAVLNNCVTEYMLALACSISPKLWKDACQVYVEQLIHRDQIIQATNFLLSLNKDEEAINLLCDKNRFKEAFTIARLRSNDDMDIVREVLEKWIDYCYTTGLFRLGAHCNIFLNELEKAGALLSKSKEYKDTILAAYLLKEHQHERAVELATDIFKRHLQILSEANFQELLISFPEIKFTRVWYNTYKYLTEEEPCTASVTKWLIGMSCDERKTVLLEEVEGADFKKLRQIIVDNTFKMNFGELMIYVSAQLALFLSGKVDPKFEKESLQHYLRALFHCYSYRAINSNRIQHNSAFPMSKVLQLMFPHGLKKICKLHFNEDDEKLAFLMKSIYAYYCDFTLNWLTGCDELPKSLKVLDLRDNSDCGELLVSDRKNLEASLNLIKNKHAKLKKVAEVLRLFLEDVMDMETVQYIQCSINVKQFDSGCNSIKGSLEEEDDTELSLDVIKEMKHKMEDYDKSRCSAPNPCLFYYNIRNFLEESKIVDPDLAKELEVLVTAAAKKCNILRE